MSSFKAICEVCWQTDKTTIMPLFVGEAKHIGYLYMCKACANKRWPIDKGEGYQLWKRSSFYETMSLGEFLDRMFS